MPCKSPFDLPDEYDPKIEYIQQIKKMKHELDTVTNYLCFVLKYLHEKNEIDIIDDIFWKTRGMDTWFDNHLYLDKERELIEKSEKINKEILKRIEKNKEI